MSLFLRPNAVLKWIARTVLTGLTLGSTLQVALAQTAPPKPEPDVIIFKNGDQLTGTLVSGTGNSIIFKTDMAGSVTVSLDNVKELRSHGAFAVLKKDALLTPKNLPQEVHPGVVTYADGAIKIDPASGVSSSVPEKDVAFIIDQPTFQKQIQRPSLLAGWNGGLTAGATSVQSSSYGTTFTLGANAVRSIPLVPYLPIRNRMIFNLSETYGKLTTPTIPQTSPVTPDAVAKSSIFHADFERDEYLSPRFYYLGDTAFDHNYAQGLNLQQLYGGGVGWTAIQQPKQQLDLKAEVHYEMQAFQNTGITQNQNLIGATLAESYRRNLPGKLLLTESGSVLPAFNNPNAYSATGNINLALPTFHRLTVNLGLSDSFINDPPIGYQKNSFQFVTGIGYTFH
jgi:hypothetical protein